MPVLLEAHHVTVVIDGRTIIDDESLQCPPGQMTALVGPSGCGKTTLLHCLGLLRPITRGRILAGGRDVTTVTDRGRRRFWRDHAAFVLQDYGIIDDDTVAFNVTMKRPARGDERLTTALRRVGLTGRDTEPASHLSGGEKQRLALARAIYRDAKVLLVDEPTASLDAGNRHAVIDLFAEFAHGGATVVIATHDDELINACDTRHELTSRQPHATMSAHRNGTPGGTTP